MSPVHCWTGRLEYLRERFGEDEGYAEWLREGEPAQTCLLLDGHEGPHEWTDDGDIRIKFLPESEPTE